MKDYINQAMRTNSHITGRHGRNSIDFAHACLGLVTELDELDNATSRVNWCEEVGDLCWYIALACHSLNVPWPESVNANLTTKKTIFALTDISKKWFAYGKHPHIATVEMLLGNIIFNLGVNNIDDAQQRNIAKLKIRFPGAFDAHYALNRNLDNELDALGNE